MQIKSPEVTSQVLVQKLIAARNRLYQNACGNLDLGYKFLLRDYLINLLVDRLDDSVQSDFADVLLNARTYNPVKYFRPLTLVETKASFDYSDEKTNFKINKGNFYLGIHLEPNEDSKTYLRDIRIAMHKMANYLGIFSDRLPADIILGITYEKLASISGRYGFQVAETPPPTNIIKKFVKASAQIPGLHHDRSNPRFCFQTCDDFIERFSKVI